MTPKNKKYSIITIIFIFSIFIIFIIYYKKYKSINISPTSTIDNKELGDIGVLRPETLNSTSEKYFYQDKDFYLQGNIGPIYDSVDINYTDPDKLSVYEVKTGDTVDSIAKLYDITPFTIMWANDLKSKYVRPGDLLLILPISGIQHTIKKGDTIKSIANKYKVNIYEIEEFNNINRDEDLKVGEYIVIPNGELPEEINKTNKNKSNTKDINNKNKKSKNIVYRNGATPLKTKYNKNLGNYFIRPMSGIRTQGLHGRNAIDIGAPVGTPVIASAGGTVLLAKAEGYNGGYGIYIIISHPNGTQTLYGHLSRLNVTNGQNVTQGQIIGYSGNSGRSTGPHLHFEIIGAQNPF